MDSSHQWKNTFVTHSAWQQTVGSWFPAANFHPLSFHGEMMSCASSCGPDLAAPDLGPFPRHVPLPLARSTGATHTLLSKTVTLTLFPGLCHIPAKSVWRRCWHFSALLESIPLLLSQTLWQEKKKKYFKKKKDISKVINWSGMFFYCRFGIQMKFQNRKKTTCSAAMLTALFHSRPLVNLKNVSPSP